MKANQRIGSLMMIGGLLVAATLNSGCASIGARATHDLAKTATGSAGKLPPYPGVITGVACAVTHPLSAPFFAVDLPLSAAVDTVLLPHDIVQLTK